MEKYVIGIDGGGSAAKGLVANLQGNILLKFEGKATNYNGGKKEEIDCNFRTMFETAIAQRKAKDCMAICVGCAGVSNPTVSENIKKIIAEMGFECPIYITSDSETALMGGIEGKSGIILIAGTGSICYGIRQDGQNVRVGGYGHIIDDEGSAYSIAKNILTAIIKSEDGRGQKTPLKEKVYTKLNISSIEELISWLYAIDRTKGQIASIAAILGELDVNDEIANEIQKNAAISLSKMLVPAISFFHGKAEIAVAGSVLIKNEFIYYELLRQLEKLYPENFSKPSGLMVHPALQGAEYGAVKLALKLCDAE